MDLLSVLDELDDEETAMLFRAIRAYNQLESENEAIRTKAEEDLEAMTANKTVRIAFAPIRKRLEADNKRYAETVQLNKAVDNFRTKYILSTAFLKKTNCTFFSYSRNPGYAQL